MSEPTTPAPANTQVPFEVIEQPTGVRVASNGHHRVVVELRGAEVLRRRAIKGIAMQTAGEVLRPQLNELVGELAANPETKAKDAVARLLAIAGTVSVRETVNVEWLLIKVGSLRVYVAGADVIVTDRDLQP